MPKAARADREEDRVAARQRFGPAVRPITLRSVDLRERLEPSAPVDASRVGVTNVRVWLAL